MLKVDKLSLARNGRAIFENLDFSLNAGEIHGLVGRNGAGKTSVLQCIAGLLRATSGQVLMDDVPLGDSQSCFHRHGLGIRYVPQIAPMRAQLTVNDFVETYEKGALVPADLGGFRLGQRVASLSGGEQQLLLMTLAASSKGRVILIDEPFAALDPKARVRVRQVLRKMAKEVRAGVLVTGHGLQEFAAFADRYTVLGGARSPRP